MPRTTATKSALRILAAVVLLSFSSGATDAFAFLDLGGIFTANMTGNLVLVGMVTRPGYAATLAGAGIAVVAFAAALYAGFRLTDARDDRLHPRVPTLLWAATAGQAVVLAAWPWLRTVDAPGRLVVVGISAASLALQTAGAKRLSVTGGVTTTYVTGTLTSVIQDIADHRDGDRLVRAGSVLALVAGALAGTGAVAWSPVLAPALPFAAGVVALLLVRAAGPGAQPA